MKPTLHEAPEGLIRKVLLGDDTLRAVRDADGRVTQYEFPGGGRVDAGTFECLRANGLVREPAKGFLSWIRPKGWEGRRRKPGL
jgi:hypothetical protein